MKKFLLILFFFLQALPLFARDYGNLYWSEYRYRVNCQKVLNVRNQPGSHGGVVFTVRNGDYIYGQPAGNGWIKADGSEWYVSAQYVVQEANPYYQQPASTEDNVYDSARVYRNQRTVRWCLLVLCIVLFIVGLVHEWDAIEDLFHSSMRVDYVKGEGGKMVKLASPLHQKFYYGPSSYAAVLSIVGLILGSIIGGVLTMLVVGGSVWLLLAIVWCILYALVFVGWVALIGGIIVTLCGGAPGCLVAIVGGLIVHYRESIHAFGDSALDTGFAFFRNLYVVDFVRDLFIIYWKPALMIAALPLAIFLAFVLITMLVSAVFMLTEYIVMRRYNIKNPCPVCQKASEPAIYLSDGQELPVPLRPGKYGIFHITHPLTLKEMPTMLFNGKDKLERRCRNCGAVISAKMGTERHIALAGVAESGKTALVYRFIAELLRRYSGQVAFTDEKDWNMAEDIKRIVRDGDMVDFPQKTAVGVMRSIQLRIERGMGMVYRLFINDVGGELYTLASVNQQDSRQIAQFVRNVDTILFLVDPMTIDFSDCELSDDFAAWLKKNDNPNIEKVNISSALKRLVELLKEDKNAKKLSRIHLDVVLVKKDLGYLSQIDSENEGALKAFMQSDMGLGGLVSDIETSFSAERTRYVSFAAVGKGEKATHVGKLSDLVLSQLGIASLNSK